MIENLSDLFSEAELSQNWVEPLTALEDVSEELTILPDWLAVELIWLSVKFGQSLLSVGELSESGQVAIEKLLSIKRYAWWQQVVDFDKKFPLLDKEYLIKQRVDVSISSLSQFLSHPKSQQLSPHPLFDCEHYKNLENINVQFQHPLVHFFRNTIHSRENPVIPNQYFSTEWYCSQFVEDRFTTNPLLHYLNHFQDPVVRPNPHFHNNYVRQTQSLLVEIDPLTYYIEQIKAQKNSFYVEGFSPCPYFDRTYYLANNPDIKVAAEQGQFEPFLHFCVLGINEGRRGHPWLREEVVNTEMIEAFRKANKKAVLVLGMHRSGTSALTRVLGLSGMDMANDLMLANEANALGYWESVELTTIHGDILNSLNSSWDDVLPIDEKSFQVDSMEQYKALLVDYIVREFSGSSRILIKDPRMCRLLPLWLDVLANLNVQVNVVLIFRHPIEVAKSLYKRDGFSQQKSFLLWIRHVLDAEKYSRGLPRCFVNYAQLLTNPQQAVKSIANLNGIKGVKVDGNAIKAFVDTQYYHQRITKADLQGAALSSWLLDIYKVLKTLSENPADDKKYQNKFNDCSELIRQADKLFGGLIPKN